MCALYPVPGTERDRGHGDIQALPQYQEYFVLVRHDDLSPRRFPVIHEECKILLGPDIAHDEFPAVDNEDDGAIAGDEYIELLCDLVDRAQNYAKAAHKKLIIRLKNRFRCNQHRLPQHVQRAADYCRRRNADEVVALGLDLRVKQITGQTEADRKEYLTSIAQKLRSVRASESRSSGKGAAMLKWARANADILVAPSNLVRLHEWPAVRLPPPAGIETTSYIFKATVPSQADGPTHLVVPGLITAKSIPPRVQNLTDVFVQMRTTDLVPCHFSWGDERDPNWGWLVLDGLLRQSDGSFARWHELAYGAKGSPKVVNLHEQLPNLEAFSRSLGDGDYAADFRGLSEALTRSNAGRIFVQGGPKSGKTAMAADIATTVISAPKLPSPRSASLSKAPLKTQVVWVAPTDAEINDAMKRLASRTCDFKPVRIYDGDSEVRNLLRKSKPAPFLQSLHSCEPHVSSALVRYRNETELSRHQILTVENDPLSLSNLLISEREWPIFQDEEIREAWAVIDDWPDDAGDPGQFSLGKDGPVYEDIDAGKPESFALIEKCLATLFRWKLESRNAIFFKRAVYSWFIFIGENLTPDLIIVDDADQLFEQEALVLPARWPQVPAIIFGDAIRLVPPSDHTEMYGGHDGFFRPDGAVGALRHALRNGVTGLRTCNNELFLDIWQRGKMDYTLSEKRY